MFTINTGLTYLAVLLLIAGGLLILQRTTKWKIFDLVPPLVWIYVLNMILCTMGIFETDAVKATYSGFKNNLLYAMIFVMLLRCDFRKLGKLGPRMIAIFLGCSLTLAIGTIAAYPIFMNSLGGGEKTWAAVAALYASWVGGSANMAAMEAAFTIDPAAYGAALALDTVCYSVWIALLLLAVKIAPKWNNAVKADTSKLDAIADAANAEIAKDKKAATAADWIFLIGISLLIGLPCAYSIARFKMRKSSVIVLMVRMIPGISFLLPWFSIFSAIGLRNTLAALVLSHMLVALPFIVWTMIPNFEAIPAALEEAAWIDGCNKYSAFFRIVIRLSTPGIVTASLLAFIFSWNNFMFSLILAGRDTTTLPVAIFNFVSYAYVDWGGLMAAAVMITLPIVILSLCLQKYIISGLTAGAVKG